ncbi:MAG: NUDIX domain-containing protein [Phycisphaerales bacterium]|nr:NUDIX domain-containing protein [Phycisphaerales bacterium]
MYRRRGEDLDVLLVHPGGPYWTGKDRGAWSIPKGRIEPGEEALAAAIREFREETSFEPAEPYLLLGSVTQGGGKRVTAWAFQGDCDPSQVKSIRTQLEWPPRSGRMIEIPEVDRAEFWTLDQARDKILPAQSPLLDSLVRRLAET